MVEQSKKKPRVRSPNYPGYSLERCIELVDILYEKLKRTSNAFEVATKAIGFSPKSSSGLQVMASLSYYGLITIEGTGANRRVSVSDLAFKIIIDKRPGSKDREAAIKEAALNPTFFRKIKEFYKNQRPNDSALEFDLPTQFKFNPGTVKDFIRVFMDTMSFAKVYENDIMPEENITSEETGMITPEDRIGATGALLQGATRPSVIGATRNEREKARYSLGGDLAVRIIFSGGSVISKKSIEKFMKLLEINKEDFIEEPPNDKEQH